MVALTHEPLCLLNIKQGLLLGLFFIHFPPCLQGPQYLEIRKIPQCDILMPYFCTTIITASSWPVWGDFPSRLCVGGRVWDTCALYPGALPCTVSGKLPFKSDLSIFRNHDAEISFFLARPQVIVSKRSACQSHSLQLARKKISYLTHCWSIFRWFHE